MSIISQNALACAAFAIACAVNCAADVPEWPKQPTPTLGAPNVVVIILDDAGYAATSAFGGLTETPALDALAAAGLSYNAFHVTAVCSPTRAALLTGRNHHRVGFGSIPEFASGHGGYNSSWPSSAASIAQLLRQNGYSTAAFGKWHNTPNWELSPLGPFDRWPTGLGFEHFYGFMVGETTQWEPPLWRDTTMIEPPRTVEQGYHVTADLADEAISWVQTLQSLAPQRPYFLYFATGAPHKPHHVPAEWIARYKGRFDAGWDELRRQIFERQKQRGIIPADARLTIRPDGLPAWDSLSTHEKKLAVAQMETFAGFLAHTDHEIGRLIDAVRDGPSGDNTVIFYLATDNGASGMEGLLGNDHSIAPPAAVATQLRRVSEAAGPKHFNGYSAGWAWMNNTPFPWMKLNASHLGGTRAPLVVSWPTRIKQAGLRGQFTYVTDIAPTIYELAGIAMPEAVKGVLQMPLDGTSFADSLFEADAPSHHRRQYFENWGSRAMYEDGWIAAQRNIVPWPDKGPARSGGKDPGAEAWELYHIDADFSQSQDVAQRYPQKLAALRALYETEARENGVLPTQQFKALTAGAPSLTAGRTHFVYHPNIPMLLSATAAPNFARPHRLVAHIEVPRHDAHGVIVSNGNRIGGFSLYVDGGHLVYENNYKGLHRDVIRTDQPLPPGKVEIAFELTGTALPTGEFSGTGALIVDGTVVKKAPLRAVASPHYGSGTFNIGRARLSPVSEAYTLPFAYNGRIDRVEVFLTTAPQ